MKRSTTRGANISKWTIIEKWRMMNEESDAKCGYLKGERNMEEKQKSDEMR